MNDDFAGRLEAGLPKAWRPDKEDPDLLVGTVIEITAGQSEYTVSGKYPILVVLDEETGEEKAVHGFHSVLQNELLRQKPQPGERVGIKYLGEQATKPGSKFKSFIGYRVKVDRVAQAFDWNEITTEHVDEPAEAPASQVPAVTVPAGAGPDEIPDDLPF